MNWTFWHRSLSPHLAPVVRCLASMPDQHVTVVAEREPAMHRKSIGWDAPDCSPARVFIRPANADVEHLLQAGRGPLSVHLLNGLANVALNREVLSRLAKTRTIIGLISESPDSRGILGLARRAKYRMDRYSFGRRLDFILAMGQLGVRWFSSAGYDASRIFPFGYFTDSPVVALEKESEKNESGDFRILYLGRFTMVKDGLTAIRALAGLSTGDWQFDLVGDGAELQRWRRAAAASGCSSRIRFRPPVDYKMIGTFLDQADLLLLPSKKDGWGAVVNEALQCGVPVVCSDKCGAADLLREPWRGSVFQAGSVEGLRKAVERWIARGKRSAESSARIRQWSSAIEGPQAARYLVDIVKHLQEGGERPCPPWY